MEVEFFKCVIVWDDKERTHVRLTLRQASNLKEVACVDSVWVGKKVE